MLLLYVLCCLPFLAHALTPEQMAQFTGGCSLSCAAQSPCGEVSITSETDSSTTEEDREIIRLTTNGVPNHPSQQCNGKPTLYKENGKRIEIPDLTPDPFEQFDSEDPKYCTPNIVGYAKNGIPFYSGKNTDCKNGNNSVEMVLDNGVQRLWAFDTCDGHASLSGVYHYHCTPRCLYQGNIDEFLGVAMDGYPIYGPRVGALGGAVATNAILDECHGRTFNDGIGYRYIVNNEYPYTVGCLRGQLRRAAECGDDQGRNTLCLCSGGDYGSGYGGSRRYKRGGGWGRWGDRKDVEAQVFPFIGALSSDTEQCAVEDNCTFEAAPSRGGRRDHDWDEDRDRDYGNGRPDIVPVLPVPVPVPVAPNEVDIAIARIQSMTPQMRDVADDLATECSRWYSWIQWNNRNCQGEIPSNLQYDCNRAADYLSHITRMQNNLRQMQRECESLEDMVEGAGRSVYVPDEIGALPNWCMFQVAGQSVPGNQRGDNDRRRGGDWDRDRRRDGWRGRN